MATRNERKRKALAKRRALEQAVADAFKADAERKAAAETLEQSLRDYPILMTGKSAGRKVILNLSGRVQGGKLVRKDAPLWEPLKHDGNASRRGQLRKRAI